MSETEIALAQAYLARSGLDPVAALVRSVRDIARMRRMLGAAALIEADRDDRYPARTAIRSPETGPQAAA